MLTALSHRHRRLCRDPERGSVSLFVLVVMSGIILIIGLVVDGSRAASATGRADGYAQEAARAAAAEITLSSALRGSGPELDVPAARAAALRYLDAAGVTGEVVIDSPTRVTVTVTLSTPTAFLSIIGKNTITVHGTGTGTATVTPVQ